MVKPLLLVGMIGIHLHLLPERMELTPGNDRHNRLCDGMQQLDECVCTHAHAHLCLCLSCWSMSVLYPCIHVCNSACHTGQRVAVQDKGLSSGGRVQPPHSFCHWPEAPEQPLWLFLTVCVCVCVLCVCVPQRAPVWGRMQLGAKWPAVNYDLLINLGKGSHRVRECGKYASTTDVTRLDLSALPVCCIWVTTWNLEGKQERQEGKTLQTQKE